MRSSPPQDSEMVSVLDVLYSHEKVQNWKKTNFLIHEHQFSYAYSASLLLHYQTSTPTDRWFQKTGVVLVMEVLIGSRTPAANQSDTASTSGSTITDTQTSAAQTSAAQTTSAAANSSVTWLHNTVKCYCHCAITSLLGSKMQEIKLLTVTKNGHFLVSIRVKVEIFIRISEMSGLI